MHWMRDWSMPYPFVVHSARGALLTDVDGNEYADFCLGDTGSMFGHSPPPVAEAVARQAARGLTYMLPTEDTIAVGRLLAERFGLPHWQSRHRDRCEPLRAARRPRGDGRPRILVFNGCYHGTVDETSCASWMDARSTARACWGRSPTSPSSHASSEFNDLPALEAALATATWPA